MVTKTKAEITNFSEALLTVIIISYNSYSVIKQCLDLVCRTDKFKVIIIDNASEDNSANLLREEYSNCDVVTLSKNFGYGRAANEGFKRTNTEFALLINPDVKASLDEIEQLLGFAVHSRKEVALWAPSLDVNFKGNEEAESVDWISGCAMLFNLPIVRKIGFFDPRIFLYYEETVLCKRLIQAGLKIKRCKTVFFKHLEGRSSGSQLNIEITKAWHYGWSKAYYFNQYELENKRKSPFRLFCLYYFKSLTCLNNQKRLIYKYRSKGVLAYLRNVNAFDNQDSPYLFTI